MDLNSECTCCMFDTVTVHCKDKLKYIILHRLTLLL